MSNYKKNRVYLAFLLLLVMLPSVAMATPKEGRDYFRQASNYDAYSMGNGRIHIKTLIFAEGSHRNWYATGPSTVRLYPSADNPFNYYFIQYQADNYYNKPGKVSGRPRDEGWVSIKVSSLTQGIIKVTNTYDGDETIIAADGQWHDINLLRVDAGDHLTYLEFDWYISPALAGNTVWVYAQSNHRMSDDAAECETRYIDLGTFTYGMDQQPQIVDPVFYPVNDNGPAGYGLLAVPYIAFQQTYGYYTEWNQTVIDAEEQSDLYYVQTCDSVRHGFRMYFQTKASNSPDDSVMLQWLPSNKVDVPAYHRIYDMDVKAYTWYDEASGLWLSDPRYKEISWKIKLPHEEDVIPFDMFQIERAFERDFSDAITIGTVEMKWVVGDSLADTIYRYVDSTMEAWNSPNVELNPNIYYRVRRASSMYWEWEGHPFAAKDSIAIDNRLPSIIASGCKYRMDDDFGNNHKVYLYISLTPVIVGDGTSSSSPRTKTYSWDPYASLDIKKVLLETSDTIVYRISNDVVNRFLDSLLRSPAPNAPACIHYVDQLNNPCTHVEYFCQVDTTGCLFKQNETSSGDISQLMQMTLQGEEPYFTDAGNLNDLEGSVEEYPDFVLLTWTVSDGRVDSYTVESRPDSNASWTMRDTVTTGSWRDFVADPSISPLWQYRVTMHYSCQGNTVTDSRTTTGARSPWGRVIGRVHYEDGSGCAGITVVATRSSDGATVQTVVTDEGGAYLLDSLPYSGGVEYTITPTSQTAQFRYNNTSSGFATVNLSLDRCVTSNIDFDNISSVRFTGRVLYENSTVPVRDANFLLNGNMVHLANSVVKTDASGNFEFRVPEGSAFTLQVVKEGHRFDSDGYVRIGGDSLLTLNAALDGVRVWDQTKIRLTGRVAGGLDQRNLPLGFGLSTNNLGTNLRFVLELEGDNISYVVRIPTDLTKDTLEYTVPHMVYGQNGTDTVGVTQVHYQQKRIIVEADTTTGEFCVDLFPVRWKVTQANATGYATLFSGGRTSETLDLGNAAMQEDTLRNGVDGRFATCNAQYKLTYRSPINITCKQLLYGMEVDYLGEQKIQRQNIFNEQILVPVATKQANGSYRYLFGAPVFRSDNYTFRAYAHEDYYYNNDPNKQHDQVRIKGGTLKVYNGMHDAPVTQVLTYELDTNGSADFTIPVDYVSFVNNTESVKRVLDLSVESEGEYVESQAIQAYVTGRRYTANDRMASTHGRVLLLDVLRDPPGSGSSAYLEAGAEYTYSYLKKFQIDLGVKLSLTYGEHLSGVIGSYAGAGGGTFIGQNTLFGGSNTVTLPLTATYTGKHDGSYTFKTTDRITTSNSPYFVGQNADVYIGVEHNVYFRHVNAVQPIDSLTFASIQARESNGTLSTVTEGYDTATGKRYYLVIGNEIEMGPHLTSTFTYTHSYIKNTIIPQLMQYRDALLLTCDSLTAISIARAQHKVVYWSRVAPDDTNWAVDGYYETLDSSGSVNLMTNEVLATNNRIADWILMLKTNEKEKALCYYGSVTDSIGTYSVSGGTTVTHTETYSAMDATHYKVNWLGGSSFNPLQQFGKAINKSMVNALNNLVRNRRNNPYEFAANWGGKKWDYSITPVANLTYNEDPLDKTVKTRTVGFTLSPDILGYMDVAVYRFKDRKDTVYHYNFNDTTSETRDHVNEEDAPQYGSPIYYLLGGASKCPCELADSTEYYDPKTPISAGTLRLENPKVDIDVHERSNVPADRAAIFTLHLYNEIEATTGAGLTTPMQFKLKMNDMSNPHGAQVFIDGMPLTDGRIITLTGRQVITKTMEVYAGVGYDFEDLVIELVSTCVASNKSRAQFSVHFMPVSCDVTLTSPCDNWVMNTLSASDSVGYYLPVSIGDFDVNYRGFDHIELQYKLTTESDEDWVNLCSYYYDSALYAAASGTKAMIEGGRIENIRFYGERDPMEQRYDLRAVSFCRHGSGFISKASEIKSGIKDTRCPRVFGDPEPANGILGVGDHLKLRFNEPIAGNYLDEDNNFQILGVTNRSGIASSTSLHLDGSPSCGAASAVTRVLSGKSFSIDLMAKPASTTFINPQELFGHSTPTGGIGFGLEPDGGGALRLYAFIDDYRVHSLPLEPLTDFTRLIMTYDNETGRIRFFAGTLDVTDPDADTSNAIAYDGNAPLVFGHGFNGNMLEARLWFKPLSQDEIAETHERRLTGYENKLAAYYPMNEGRGNICTDKASGSTLTLQGTSWTTPSGFSLHLDGTNRVSLAQDILSRSLIQDYTLMFWFRTFEYNQALFSAGWDGSNGTLISMNNGRLSLRNGDVHFNSSRNYADGQWHHFVLSVCRTYNNVSVYVDGELLTNFASDALSGLSGSMFLGGISPSVNPQLASFNGHIDDFVLFEQALPSSLIETYDNLTPVGDEMGLVALLTFSEQRRNNNNILEEVFSINNQRVFKLTDGTVVDKVQPLVIAPDSTALLAMADNDDHAPIRERDLLSNINFDWSFNQDELLININMQDREINKNNIYVTVRNVEDLNGNRTVSPSMWQVFVNKNTLLWNSDGIYEVFYEQADPVWEIPVQIMNVSGRRHQFTIDGLPDWMSVNQSYGSINPQETQTLRFSIHDDLPVGVFSEIIYLTDEDGLSEPLKVFVEIRAICPWDDVDPNQFDRQMSLMGRVMVDGVIDTDPNDVVVAMVDNQIIGRQNISFNNETSSAYLFMTIYGNNEISNDTVTFRLWQASSGRIYSLASSPDILFSTNGSVGLPPQDPVILSTSVNEVQYLELYEGWNWVSLNIKPDHNGALNGLFYSPDPFSPGDQIKSASSQQFAEWDGEKWMGSLTNANYRHTFMIYCDDYHWSVQVPGRRFVSNSERTISLRNGWNSFPYLLNSTQSVTNALADYIEKASVGDIVKSQTKFAVFNSDNHWIGSLTALTPGEGYLLFRNDTTVVPFVFRNTNAKGHQTSSVKHHPSSLIPQPSSNMTVIAKVDANPALSTGTLYASVANTLVGVAELQIVDDDSLFFLSVGTDIPGTVSFFIDNDGVRTELYPVSPLLANANRHYGTLDRPLILSDKALTQSHNNAMNINAYPTIFDDYVDVIVSGDSPIGEAVIYLYTAIGVKVGTWTVDGTEILNSKFSICDLQSLSSGVYFLTVTVGNHTSSIKLIKK